MDHVSQCPLGFILYGVLADGTEVGLKLIPDFRVRIIQVKSNTFGVPQVRDRSYIVMAKDGEESSLDRPSPFS